VEAGSGSREWKQGVEAGSCRERKREMKSGIVKIGKRKGKLEVEVGSGN
jgi:hypothetical protein